ncbi:hypothetical protein GGS21DRAFT_93464 [Xylaria nigripes]|nr:hypothetical protein GGS21DRAFT_93464 [Xylaria nigripes]
MPSFSSWFLPAFFQSRSSRNQDPTSSSNRSTDRVLHGRVTQTSHTKAASAARSKNHGVFARGSEDSNKDEATMVMMPVGPLYKRIDEQDKVEKEEGEAEGNDNGGNGAKSALALPFATTVHPACPKTTPNSEVESQQNSSEDSSADSPDSELGMDSASRLEQIYLNTILKALNEFTLMPSTWKMHFRGIPLPNTLFYVKTKQKSIRPRIYARTDKFDYRGALALRKLIAVNARIQDIREREAAIQCDKETTKEKKQEFLRGVWTDMAKQLRRALQQALDWAKKDGDIEKYGGQFPPNVKIMEFKGISTTNKPEYEVKIQAELCGLAEEWRTHASNGEANGIAPVQPPVIFGFIIMKHIITIATLDASEPGAVIQVPCKLHMAEKNQHQWNALAIMVTICWARDVLLEYVDVRPDLQVEVNMESSDPDA